MSPTIFIAVPVGTASGPEWRGVIARHGEQGFKIFWCASVLAELAAKAARGGLLAFASGEPKTALELCAELGVEPIWSQEVLFPALERLGEGYWAESGGWVCTSSMASRTLEWQGDRLALPAPSDKKHAGRKSMFSQQITDAEYRQWKRTCRLPAGVVLLKPCPRLEKQDKSCLVLSGKCPVCPVLSGNCPEIKTGHNRTKNAEDAEIIEDENVRKPDKLIEVNPIKTVVVAETGHPTTTTLSENLLEAIKHLPLEMQQNAIDIMIEEESGDEVKISAVLRCAAEIREGKERTGGWLRKAIRNDYGKQYREKAEKKEKSKQQQADYQKKKDEEQQRKESQIANEKQRFLALQKDFLRLADSEKESIEQEARSQILNYGLDPSHFSNQVVVVFSQRYGIPY